MKVWDCSGHLQQLYATRTTAKIGGRVVTLGIEGQCPLLEEYAMLIAVAKERRRHVSALCLPG